MIDTKAAKTTLESLNGCNLKAKLVIVEYAQGSKSPSLPLVAKPSEKTPIRSKKPKYIIQQGNSSKLS
jgi:hypothetical protein